MNDIFDKMQQDIEDFLKQSDEFIQKQKEKENEQ